MKVKGGRTAKSIEDYYYEKDAFFGKEEAGSNISYQGVLAEALGLVNGEILTKEQLGNIVDAKTKDGTPLTTDGGNEKKRGAIEFVFSPPKSYSHFAFVLGNEEAMGKIQEEAVKIALNYVEENFAKTREYVKDSEGKIALDPQGNKIREIVTTGNLAFLKVMHSTSRPVEGQAPDPHLHTHVIIPNITYHDGKFKAISNEDFFSKKMEVANQIYQSSIAKLVEKEFGVGIDKLSKGSHEISGYDRDTIEGMSKRHDQTLEKKEELLKSGVEFSKGKLDEVSQHTSKSSKSSMSYEDMRISWENQHNENPKMKDLEALKKDINDSRGKESGWKFDAKDTLKISAQNLTKNESVFTKEALITEALKLSRGTLDYSDFEKEIKSIQKTGQKSFDDIKKLAEGYYTTKEIFDKEREIISIIKKGRKVVPLLSKENAELGIEAFKDYKTQELGKEVTLTNSQYRVLQAILTSDKAYIIIDGPGGAGKSFDLEGLRFIADWAEKKGITIDNEKLKSHILALSTTGRAAANLESATKISSSTISKFLLENKLDLETYAQKQISSFSEIVRSHVSLKNGMKKDIFDDKKFQVGGGFVGYTNDSHVIRNRSKFLGVFKDYKKETITEGEFKGSVQVKNLKISDMTIESKVKNTFNDGTEVSRNVTSYNQKGTLGKLASLTLGGKDTEQIKKNEKKGTSQVISTKERSLLGAYKKLSEKTESTFKYGEEKEKTGVATQSFSVTSVFGKETLTAVKSTDFNGESKKIEEYSKTKSVNGFIQSSGVTTTLKKGVHSGSTFFRETTSDKDSNQLNGFMVSMNNGFITNSTYVKDMKTDKTTILETKYVGKYLAEEVGKFTESLKKDIHSLDYIDRKAGITMIDEIGMTSVLDGHAVISKIESENGQGILSGDLRQYASVGQGNMYEDIMKYCRDSVELVVMDESVRQRGKENKEVAKLFEDGNFKEAIELMDSRGQIIVEKDFEKRVGLAVDDFLSHKDDSKSIIIAYTNKELDYINASVREKKFGSHDFGEKFDLLAKQNYSELDKRTADNFSTKNVIRGYSETGASKEFNVVSKDVVKNTLQVSDKDGVVSTFDLKKEASQNFEVLEKRDTSLAVGDSIVFSKNEKNKGIFNGERAEILKIEGSVLHLRHENSKEMTLDTKDYKDIKHGYAVTNYKVQGSSFENVSSVFTTEKTQINDKFGIFDKNDVRDNLQDSKKPSVDKFNESMKNISTSEVSKNAEYVSESRHKQELKTFTDSKEALQNVKEQFKTSTLDFENEKAGKEMYDKIYEAKNGKVGHTSLEASDVDMRKEINAVKTEAKRGGVVDINDVKAKTEGFRQDRDSKSLDSDVGRKGQRGFMDGQAVLRNGVSTKALRDFAENSVSKNYMTREDADKFVVNSLQNAENLEKVGILKFDGKDNYKFVDDKAKEILSKNLAGDYKEIGTTNLKAYEKFKTADVEKAQDKTVEKPVEKENKNESVKTKESTEEKQKDNTKKQVQNEVNKPEKKEELSR